MAKADIGMLVGSILKKKPGKPDEETEIDGPEEEEGEFDPREGIAQDLISAVKAEDAAAVMDALDAVQEAWSPKTSKNRHGADKEDCGCR